MPSKTIESLVSTQWLADELGASDLHLFDASVAIRSGEKGQFVVESGAEVWAEGHLPTSAHLDLVGALSDPDAASWFTAAQPDALARTFANLGVGDDSRVVIYDNSMNMWATRVWWQLRSIGFDGAAVLDGGFKAWKSDGRELTTSAAPSRAPASLTARPRPGTFVDTAFVQQAVESGSSCVLNALSEANHRGDDLTYGAAGHLPGALNVPAQGLVDPDTHRYLPLDALAEAFASVSADGGPVITYCGGGIAATSDAFILHLLGRDDISVYDGSLTEWIGDGLPLES